MKLVQLIYLFFVLPATSCSKKNMPETTVITVPGVPTPEPVASLRIVNVSTVSELKKALSEAKAGDEIIVKEGVYSGKFIVPVGVNGTEKNPIVIRGVGEVKFDAGNFNTGYVLHLQASYWVIKDISITNGLKGIMMDGASYNTIKNVTIFKIGEEALHIRKHSKHNLVQNCTISQTGLKTADYGEGIYIGSAKNNWANYTNGLPDLSDSNSIVNNKIGPAITAECIDIKEGTTGTIIRGNTFDATGITGANGGDSWIDVKGNYALIENNTGWNPGGNVFIDGYQVHCAVNGWGNYNEFKNNTSVINATGFGFNIQLSGSNGTTTGNKVYSNNVVTGATRGVSNIPLSN